MKTSVLVFLAGALLVVETIRLSRTPAPPQTVVTLRDELASCWRSQAFVRREYAEMRARNYALQEAFTGCVCQDGGTR